MIHFQVVRVPRTDYDNFGYVIGLTILTQQLSMSKENSESSSRTRRTPIDRSISFDISPKMFGGCSWFDYGANSLLFTRRRSGERPFRCFVCRDNELKVNYFCNCRGEREAKSYTRRPRVRDARKLEEICTSGRDAISFRIDVDRVSDEYTRQISIVDCLCRKVSLEIDEVFQNRQTKKGMVKKSRQSRRHEYFYDSLYIFTV